MKIFLTGGTGFIGNQVTKRLVGRGHEVRGLVRPTSDVRPLTQLGVRLARGDLTDRASLLEGMRGSDWLVNVGAAYSFWTPDPRVYREVNVEGTRNVMGCALELGVSKVVHVSTAAVYGRPAESPVTENTQVGPMRFSEYAETKYEGELVAWHLHETRGLPLVVVYPAGVLGPGDPKASGQYILDLIHRRMPATVFDDVPFAWVHVRDVAEGIVRAAEKEHNTGERYLLAGQSLTFGEINTMISEIASVPLPRVRLPDALATASAALFTAAARLTKRPPVWGMSVDQIRTMKEGLVVDGGKAERELGIRYTPVRVALEEAIESYRH